MNIDKLARKFMTKIAFSLTDEEAARTLGVSKSAPKELIYHHFETLTQKAKEADDLDREVELEAALRKLIGINDANLDNYGRPLGAEKIAPEDTESDDLDKEIEEYQRKMFSMTEEEAEAAYHDLNERVKKLTNK